MALGIAVEPPNMNVETIHSRVRAAIFSVTPDDINELMARKSVWMLAQRVENFARDRRFARQLLDDTHPRSPAIWQRKITTAKIAAAKPQARWDSSQFQITTPLPKFAPKTTA